MSSAFGTPATSIRPNDLNAISAWGADPTGAISAVAAIQNAINAAAAQIGNNEASLNSINAGGNWNRARVTLPPGNYTIDGSITMHPNVELYGPGARLRVTTTNPAFVASYSYHANLNFAFRGVEFYGAAGSWDGTSATDRIAVKAVFADLLVFDDVTWTGMSVCYDLDRCNYMRESNCLNKGSLYRPGGTSRCYSSVYTGDGTDYIGSPLIQHRFNFNVGNAFSYQVMHEFTRTIGADIDGMVCNDCRTGAPPNVTTHGHRVIAFYGDCQGCCVRGGLIGAFYDGVFFGKNLRATADTHNPTFCKVVNTDLDSPERACVALIASGAIELIGGNYTGYGTNDNPSYGVFSNAPSGYGNNFLKCVGLMIDGFSASQQCGMQFAGGMTGCSLIGNTFSNCNIGVGFAGTSDNRINVQTNSFVNCPNPIVFAPGTGLAAPNQNIVKNNQGAGDVFS